MWVAKTMATTASRRRRRRLPRIHDWDDGVQRILSGGLMFGPVVWIGKQTGALRLSDELAHDGDAKEEGASLSSIHPSNQQQQNQHQTKDKTYFLDANGLNQIRPPKLEAVHISFALQTTEGGPGVTYERLIHDHGIVLTRNNSWHDILNALTWFYLPRAKRALNRCQIAAATNNPSQQGRSPLQARLAHFDECGGIVILPSYCMVNMLKEHDWIGLFYTCRRYWLNKEARMVVFGHGLLEQGLVQIPTMVAHSLVFVVAQEGTEQQYDCHGQVSTRVNDWNNEEFLDFLDLHVGNYFDRLRERIVDCETEDDTALFSTLPIPILGIPGWCEGNDHEDFYKCSKQFR